ncbi:hypothetical protein GC177_02675 [bacterium]|nr:hypothetical protein [bacterium]
MSQPPLIKRYPLTIDVLRQALINLRLQAGLDAMGEDGPAPVHPSIKPWGEADIGFSMDQGKILLKLPVPNGDYFLGKSDFYSLGPYKNLMNRLVVDALRDVLPDALARTGAGTGEVWFFTGPDGKVPADEKEMSALHNLSHEDMARCTLYLVIDCHKRLEEFLHMAEAECSERQMAETEEGHGAFDYWMKEQGGLADAFNAWDSELSGSSGVHNDGPDGGVPELV